MLLSLADFRFGRGIVNAVFLAAFISAPSFTATIFSSTHLYTHPRNGAQVQIDVDIFDNYQGDYSKSEWRYTIYNISYPQGQALDKYTSTDGLSGFYLPFGVLPISLDPIVTPLSGFTWCGGCIINDFGFSTGPSSGVAWYEVNCAPNGDPPCVFPGGFTPGGIPIGSSIELSILMRNPVLITETQAHIFSTGAGFGKFYKADDMIVQIEAPGVPEPVTTVLVGAGLIILAAMRLRTSRR
jgi:hypothetical protein